MREKIPHDFIFGVLKPADNVLFFSNEILSDFPLEAVLKNVILCFLP